MKSLKFIRSVAVSGVHRELGSVHDIDDSDATILISDGAAVAFTAPVKVAPETTEAKRPSKETASRK